MASKSLTRRVTTFAFVLAAACADSTGPDSFLGLWTGSNSVFSRFQLNLQSELHPGQVPDTVWGSVLFIFAQSATTVADTDFIAVTGGDSLTFSMRFPPSLALIDIDFRGQRRGARIHGMVNGVPITLGRASN